MVVNVERSDNQITAFFSGRLDTTTTPSAEEILSAEIKDEQEIIFDLKDLEYISSTGLRLLLQWQKNANKQGQKLKVVNVNEEVNEILDITGFCNILHIE